VIDQVNAQIERFSGLSFQWPAFPPPLERQFEADTAPRRSARLALEGVIALTLFDLFLIADRLASPLQFQHALIVRLGIVTPIAIAINFLQWRMSSSVFRETGKAFTACIAALSHLYLERHLTAVNSAYALVGVLILVIYANNVVRLRFPYALAATGIMLLGDLVFLHYGVLLHADQKLLGLILTLCTMAVTLIANYSSNREDRLNFLLRLRGDLLVKDLHRTNERLAGMAETDGLTGLSNRLGFDLQFETLWAEAMENGTPFSIVMVDVDHFKRTNDNYGHLYGDKVLKRIARLILEALRKEKDCACRFGGEEFVVLLPETPQAPSLLVAERLRSLINLAGFPPIDAGRLSLGPVSATVSCGVATTIPQSAEERHELLAAADKALYAAKSSGRNCVRAAAYISRVAVPQPASPVTEQRLPPRSTGHLGEVSTRRR
jgi:diguanylate cyclase (GGDEF)-like protein